MADLVRLSRYARTVDVVFTDPDMSSRRDVFEAIAASDLDLRLEAEVSGLADLPTLIAMHRAGLRSVQIGIESFSPRLIRRFTKGVRLIRYLELMRWCQILGIELTYNIIVGAPFETQADVDLAVANIKPLWFLSPPIISEFVVSVGSPIHLNHQRFGISSLSSLPETACYPSKIRESLGPLLSFHAGFGYQPSDDAVKDIDHSELVATVSAWWDYAASSPDCRIFRGPDFLDVEYRIGEVSRHLQVTDPNEIAIMSACRVFARTRADLDQLFPDAADGMDQALTHLVAEGLLFTSEDHYLTLPLVSRQVLFGDAGAERHTERRIDTLTLRPPKRPRSDDT